jgi:hypothetical protein
MKLCIRTHSGDAMIIGSTNISSPAPAITGQMAHIVFAKELRQDAKSAAAESADRGDGNKKH